MKTQVLRVFDDGWRNAIVIEARKSAYLIAFGTPIRVQRVPREDVQHMKPTTYRGKPYPVARAIEHLERSAASHGITQRASTLLERIKSGEITTDVLVEDSDEDTSPVKPATVKRSALAGDKVERVARSNILAEICTELKLEGTIARRRLRKAGLSAPYTDAKAIRAILEAKS